MTTRRSNECFNDLLAVMIMFFLEEYVPKSYTELANLRAVPLQHLPVFC